MVNKIIQQLKESTQSLIDATYADMEDVRKANHTKLLERNSYKQELMEQVSILKQQLNDELSTQYHEGKNISVYKDSIDELELSLRDLHRANQQLASIVLPVRDIYKEIIDEITQQNGGSLIEVTA
jgi:hypothetical protein